MSDEIEYSDDDSALAAEYVLGVLAEEEVRAFERRLSEEDDLRALCAAWEDHFADLGQEVAEVEPPKHVWAGIQNRLYEPKQPLWRRLWLGRTLIGGALAAAIAFAAVQLDWLTPEPEAPMTATLANDAADQIARIDIDPNTGRIAAELTGAFPGAGRARELWLIQGESAPVSLGLLAPGTVIALTLPAHTRAALDGAILAISDEPSGGSPTGQPTGRVLATGVITAS